MMIRDVLYNDDQLGPFPTQLLKYVDKPTNRIVGPIERRDPRENAFARAWRGDLGKEIQKEGTRMSVKYPIGAAMIELQTHINTIRKNPNKVAPHKAPIPDDPTVLSRHFKSLGYFLGADMVGIGRLPQSAVYTHDWMDGWPIEAPYEYAIVLVNRKMDRAVRPSSGWDHIVDAASFTAYQQGALQSEVMANYIRRLGHEAEASNMLNYLTLMPQVLLEAGIGEVCRMGIILNPFLGANFKGACVLTNLELEIDGPIDFGLQQFCQRCRICAEQCPAQTIPYGEQVLYNGYYTWKLDTDACASFDILNQEGGGVCGRCTKVCPWHRPNSEPQDFANWDSDIATLHRGVNEQRKHLLENNFVDPKECTDKWWFELEEVNGRLIVPTGRNSERICREHPLAKSE
jgi:ferredoxin